MMTKNTLHLCSEIHQQITSDNGMENGRSFACMQTVEYNDRTFLSTVAEQESTHYSHGQHANQERDTRNIPGAIPLWRWTAPG
jgi:hypothetical protein